MPVIRAVLPGAQGVELRARVHPGTAGAQKLRGLNCLKHNWKSCPEPGEVGCVSGCVLRCGKVACTKIFGARTRNMLKINAVSKD